MKISIVTTLYYSADYIREFYERTKKTLFSLGIDYEFVFVNDGSPDDSVSLTLELQKSDPKILLIDLSRNFGHHKAIMTGLGFATGQYVFLIDVDLEEEPELLCSFWNEMQKDEKLDVVYGVQKQRKGGWFERLSGRLFYKLFALLSDIAYPKDTLTARLMKKKYVESVLNYKERELEIWGIFVLTGYNQKGLLTSKGNKGTSTYTLTKKLRMAVNSVTSFSSKPLYIIFVLGCMITFFAFTNILIIIFQKYYYNDQSIAGWASILASIWLIGGITISILGIIGIYLAKLFSEIKNRPLTIVKDIYQVNEKK